jgi:glycosyltransferase involved in cell wall biosynthesis
VRHLGHVRTALLQELLERTRALLFFSLFEGFGMPLLEAFAAGTPVLCSNTTSLPEIGGDAVLSCDPLDIGAQAHLMARILDEPTTRTSLVERGYRRLTAYSWEESARQLHEACRRVALGSPSLSRVEVHSPPIVSIVTPSFNQGRFLRRTIDSVLGQTYPHIEYRVCDGGSTDDSVAILRSYGDRFDWVSEPDRGQTHAINKGFAHARGQILAYLNSDDVLLPDAIEKVVRWFDRNPEHDLVYGDAHYIDEDDRIIGRYATEEYSFARLVETCVICQPAAFWRSRISRAVGPFDEQLKYAMDYDYWLRIDRAGGRIAYWPELLACSRMYPQTKTASARTAIFDEMIDVCRRAAGFVSGGILFCSWYHHCHERTTGWARRFRNFPRLLPLAERLYYEWVRQEKALVPLAFRLARLIVRKLPGARRLAQAMRRFFRNSSGPVVQGFQLDNWMLDHCTVRLAPVPGGRRVYLDGVAPVDSTLTIRREGKVVERRHLPAGEVIRIELDTPTERPEMLKLEFSNHVPGDVPRSFHVRATNLFGEADLAA